MAYAPPTAMVLLLLLAFGCSPAVTPRPDAGGDGPPPPPHSAASSAPIVDGENAAAVPAETGVGRAGQQYDGGGYLSGVMRARHRVEESLAFAQAHQALQIYKAQHGGRGPASHEAYMRDVIEANHIRLPDLNVGEAYRYDPQSETLAVVSQ